MTLPRILIVDDDDPFRERLAKAFRAHTYEIATASSTEEAEKVCATFNPTHAVVDLRIGSGSGLDLLDKIASEGRCRTVLLTGYGSIATAMEAVRRGAINYLTKPVTFSDIEAALFGDPLTPRKEARPSVSTVPSLDEVEWEHIQRVLRDSEGNITHAAAKLGVHRQALQRKLKKSPSRSQ